MSYRRVSQIALVVVIVALVACSGDQTSPTQPALGSLASLSAEAPGGNGGGRGGGGGGGGNSSYQTFAASGDFDTAGTFFSIGQLKDTKKTLEVHADPQNPASYAMSLLYLPGTCDVTEGSLTAAEMDALLARFNDGTQERTFNMVVDRSGSGSGRFGTHWEEGLESFNAGVASDPAFGGDVTVVQDVDGDGNDTFTFTGGRLLIQDLGEYQANEPRITVKCHYAGSMTASLKK